MKNEPKTPPTNAIESDTLLADVIVNDLFTDGSGKIYDRLVMENEDGTTSNCGWGKFEARSRIIKHITANAPAQPERTE